MGATGSFYGLMAPHGPLLVVKTGLKRQLPQLHPRLRHPCLNTVLHGACHHPQLAAPLPLSPFLLAPALPPSQALL
jgi:hypothetical protein